MKEAREPALSWPIDLSKGLDPGFVGRVAVDPELRSLAPYVYQQVLRNQPAVPDESLQTLRHLDVANRFFCTIRHDELRRRLEAFAAGSVPAIPLKGTWLAERLYGDVGGRALGVDLDLLVRREDVVKAAALLERDGYQPAGPADRYDRPFERLEDDSSTTTVELHAELLPRWFRAAGFTTATWSRARPPADAGFPAWTLDPADEVLHLCAHLIKDQVEIGSGLPQIQHGLDLHLVLERWGPAMDWPEFRQRARAVRLHAYAALAFEFVAHRFGSVVPEAIAAELPAWKRAFFERRIWTAGPAGRGRSLPLRKELRLLGLILFLDDTWPARFDHLGWAASELRRRWRG